MAYYADGAARALDAIGVRSLSEFAEKYPGTGPQSRFLSTVGENGAIDDKVPASFQARVSELLLLCSGMRMCVFLVAFYCVCFWVFFVYVCW